MVLLGGLLITTYFLKTLKYESLDPQVGKSTFNLKHHYEFCPVDLLTVSCRVQVQPAVTSTGATTDLLGGLRYGAILLLS